MSIGNSIIGGSMFGNQTPAATGAALELIFTDTIPAELVAPSPYLHFFDLETSDAVHLRVVDWGDPEAAATAGVVTFDGNDWTSVALAIPEYETDGSKLTETTVAVNDPTRSIMTWIKANSNLKNAKVTTRVIRYDQISDPTLSTDRTFRIKGIQGLDNPARVQFVFGAPSFADSSFPAVAFTRSGCHNVFERRFVHDLRNFCNYPSDEFEIQTKQLFETPGIDAETEMEFGWFVIRGDTGESGLSESYSLLSLVDTSAVGNGLRLGNDKNQRFHNANTEAHAVYKKIIDDPPNSLTDPLDVSTRILLKADANTQNGQMCGLIVVSVDDPTDWLIFAAKTTNDGNVDLEWRAGRRLTTSGTSVDINTSIGDIAAPVGYSYDEDNAFRIVRAGSSWTFYTRSELVGKEIDDSDSWKQHTALNTTWAVTGDIQVGLVNFWGASTQGGTTQFDAYFSHFRFLAGGYVRCNRTLGHCAQRKNVHQRNAYVALPDNIVRF